MSQAQASGEATTGSALHVEVVAADHRVWSGDASSIIAKTVDGDIGILPRHEPVLAVLVPGAVEVVTTNGSREIVAVDGGFISVARDRVSILSEYADMAGVVNAAEAEENLRSAQAAIDGGDDSPAAQRRLQRATAQVRAAAKAS